MEKCSQKDDHGQFHRTVASITGGGPRRSRLVTSVVPGSGSKTQISDGESIPAAPDTDWDARLRHIRPKFGGGRGSRRQDAGLSCVGPTGLDQNKDPNLPDVYALRPKRTVKQKQRTVNSRHFCLLGRTGEVKGHGVGSGCGLCRDLTAY